MIITRATCPTSIKRSMKIIKKNKLHHEESDSGFCNILYNHPWNQAYITCITIASINNNYVGCCIQLAKPIMQNCDIGVFVIEEYRRKGVGTALLHANYGESTYRYYDNYQFPAGFPKCLSAEQVLNP